MLDQTLLSFLENDTRVMNLCGIDFAHAYRNVDKLLDTMCEILTRFEYSPGYYEMFNSDFLLHPSSEYASWETFRQIMIKHFGITSVYELFTDDEDEIENCSQLVSFDFSHQFKHLVFWQVDRAFDKLAELRTMLLSLMYV